MEELWLTLATRAGVTILVVVAASLVAERLGPLWGGLVATLPVSAGPAYVMLAMQHPPGFIAEAALGSVAANPATVLFGVVFTRLVVARGLAVAMPAALLAWLAAILAIRAVAWSTAGAVLLNILVHGAGLWLTRAAVLPAPRPGRATGRGWYDLPLRAALVGALVAAVVTGSHLLGPRATGIGAVVPVTYTSLLIIVALRQGPEAAAAIMASALRGFVGFSLGFLALHGLAVPMGSAAALVLALGVMLAWSAGVLAVRMGWR